MHPLVVVAVEAERAAVKAAAPHVDVMVAGVGPVAAAVAATTALIRGPRPGRPPYSHVLSLGIAGAFDPAAQVLVATRAVAADLGVEDGDDLSVMGLGGEIFVADASLAARLSAGPGVVTGDLLTVWRVTATSENAARLRARYPDAVGEAMEGYGVAAAAAAARLPFAEIRTVSNLIGPRDREGWDIRGALARLTDVARAVLT